MVTHRRTKIKLIQKVMKCSMLGLESVRSEKGIREHIKGNQKTSKKYAILF